MHEAKKVEPTGAAGKLNPSFEHRRVLVMGLGRFGGGITVTRWLAGQGARVVVTDLADAGALADSLEQISDLDVGLRLGGHKPEDLDDIDLVIVNPAVNKSTSSFFQAIVERGVDWTTEINLFLERCPARVVGVTGSLGKSTTAAMLHHVLAVAGETGNVLFRQVYLGGNIGRSLLGALGEMTADDVVVLELSSFQLEDLPVACVSPGVAVVTNMVPHHLDRHGTFEAYVSAKCNIARFQKAGDAVVLGPGAHGWLGRFEQITRGCAGSAGVDAHAGTGAEVVCAGMRAVPTLRSLGRHNVENASLAAAVAERLGLAGDVIDEALGRYRDLPHRLEVLATSDGLRWINDSKSSTPAATMTALEAVGRVGVLIMGGKETGADFGPVCARAAEACHVVICYGENGRRVGAVMKEQPRDLPGASTVILVDTLSQAVDMARQHATPGATLLFSPGSPSYDQFQNFEKRGEALKRIVAQCR